MHLANELNWLGPHLGSIPFPAVQPAGGSATPTGGDNVEAEITIVGENIAFDRSELTIEAGVETTITFENRDGGVPHNFHIEGGAAGDFKTDIESGPVTQTLTFTITEPGTYTFLCDVHPPQMTGTLTVR
jgi:plastocyanin